MGSTLTLNQTDGNLLIAFVSFWVTFVGGRLFRIVCTALHLSSSSSKPQDGLHHQRQAFFRNSADAIDGFVAMLQMLRAWRLLADRPWKRLLPLIMFLFVWVIAWTVASGFSSQVRGY